MNTYFTPSVKEHFYSAIITFITGFSLAVVAIPGPAAFTKDSVLALVLVGVRGGIKLLFQLALKPEPTV